MINSRNKGNAYERKLAKMFREFGFENCRTSRYESKMLDDMKVDLTNTGIFNIQAKAVERLSPTYHDILASMPQDTNYNLICHKRKNKGSIVVLPLKDFMELMEMLKMSKSINVR